MAVEIVWCQMVGCGDSSMSQLDGCGDTKFIKLARLALLSSYSFHPGLLFKW